MANPYQAYGNNVPSLSYSKPVTTNPSRYPPRNNSFGSNYQFHPTAPQDRPAPKREDSNGSKDNDTTVLMREVLTRTPSPTPEEAAELKQTGVFDWKAMSSWRYWIRREWLCTCFPPLWFYAACVVRIAIAWPPTCFVVDTH